MRDEEARRNSGASLVSQQGGDNSRNQERPPALPVTYFSKSLLRPAFAGLAGEEASYVHTGRNTGEGRPLSVEKFPLLHIIGPKGQTDTHTHAHNGRK